MDPAFVIPIDSERLSKLIYAFLSVCPTVHLSVLIFRVQPTGRCFRDSSMKFDALIIFDPKTNAIESGLVWTTFSTTSNITSYFEK